MRVPVLNRIGFLSNNEAKNYCSQWKKMILEFPKPNTEEDLPTWQIYEIERILFAPYISHELKKKNLPKLTK